MTTPADPTPERRPAEPDGDDLDPRLITACRVILLLLLAALFIELAL